MALLADNETVYAKFMNNRPLCVNGIRLVGDSGSASERIYFHIMDIRTYTPADFNNYRHVYLRVRGLVFGRPGNITHGHPSVGNHTHPVLLVSIGTGFCPSGSGGGHSHPADGIATTAVPKNTEIWINGTDRTTDIGDPNTMPEWTGSDWGSDGTTEWDTGLLDITTYINNTTEEQLIELKETGSSGGRLNYEVYIV